MENSNRKREIDRVDKYGIASKYVMDTLARFALVREQRKKKLYKFYTNKRCDF